MPGERKTVPLAELYDFSSGLSKPRSEFGSGSPFLSFKDVFYNTFVPKDLTELVASTPHERRSCSIAKGDVFLTRTSETQEELGMSCVALTDYEGATFNGFTKRLRPTSDKIVPEYAGYFFRSPSFRRQVDAMSTLSTRASLNNEMLERLFVDVPPKDEQVAIGRSLKAFDDKVELNRRMSETLEEVARAIFKSWFVDFDPVRAKVEGRELCLPNALSDLFPDRFVDSDLGEIPNGWDVRQIGEVVDVVGGSTPSTKEPAYWDGAHFFATPRDLSGLAGPVLLGTERTITEEGVQQISSGLLPPGTVLLSSRAPIGYVALARVPVCVNQGFIAMICDKDLPSHFVVQWAIMNVETFKQNAGGTTFAEISKRIFKPLPVLVPSNRVLDVFEALVGSLYSRIESNLKEAETLSAMREALLPRLISGEVRLNALSA